MRNGKKSSRFVSLGIYLALVLMLFGSLGVMAQEETDVTSTPSATGDEAFVPTHLFHVGEGGYVLVDGERVDGQQVISVATDPDGNFRDQDGNLIQGGQDCNCWPEETALVTGVDDVLPQIK